MSIWRLGGEKCPGPCTFLGVGCSSPQRATRANSLFGCELGLAVVLVFVGRDGMVKEVLYIWGGWLFCIILGLINDYHY